MCCPRLFSKPLAQSQFHSSEHDSQNSGSPVSVIEGDRSFDVIAPFIPDLRDDLGKYKDNTPVNYEVSYSRGISEGIYAVNIHLYREDKSPFQPIVAKLVISIINPDTKARKQILKSEKLLKDVGAEITIFQFALDKKGNLDKDSIE